MIAGSVPAARAGSLVAFFLYWQKSL